MKFTRNVENALESIVKVMTASRIRWLRHLFRYANAVPALLLGIFSRIEGIKLKDRTPIRWIGDVEKDFKLIGVSRWRVILPCRIRWRKQRDRRSVTDFSACEEKTFDFKVYFLVSKVTKYV